jgi:enoyl-CoA hydratase
MEACGPPIIGAVNGPAITGGFEIALSCDVLIASTRARFADTHARVGVLPGAGLSQRLSRAIGIYRAKYLSLTGNFLSAEQAAEWGLVSHVVEPEALLDTAEKIAADMLSAMPAMLAPIKAIIDEGFAGTLGDGLEAEARASARHMAEMRPQSGAGAALEGLRDRSRTD